jgi:hypothetical protein
MSLQSLPLSFRPEPEWREASREIVSQHCGELPDRYDFILRTALGGFTPLKLGISAQIVEICCSLQNSINKLL